MRTARAVVAGSCAAALSLLVLACGTADDDSAGAGENGGESVEEIRAHWLYTGPQDDGGYNTAMQVTQNAMDEVEGVETTATFEVPYSQRASQITRQAIAQGANVVVETLGLANLFTDVCKENPEVYCFPTADPAKQAPNSRSWWLKDWELNYTAGVAAGLMTKTNELGFIGSFDVPLIRQAVNTYALGCQSVNPQCEVRVIWNDTYFDPSKESAAARSLINAGADVIRNWVDSPAFCQVAAEEGVYAVGEFHDFQESCPDSSIVSTIWNWDDYFVEQMEQIKDGTWQGGGIDIVDSGTEEGGPHLSEYGEFVPDDVRSQVDEVYQQFVDGEEVIVGPIRDQNGKVRFAEGEAPSERFMFSEWTWYVDGVIGG